MDKQIVAHPDYCPRRDIHEETPHGCYDGWVYLGFEGEDENGEQVEEIERVPCRRCRPELAAESL